MAWQMSWTGKEEEDKDIQDVGKILAEGKRFPTGWPWNMEQQEAFQKGKGQLEQHAMSLDMIEAMRSV